MAKRVPKVMENLLVLTAFTAGMPTAYKLVRDTSPPPPAMESMNPARAKRNDSSMIVESDVKDTFIGLLFRRFILHLYRCELQQMITRYFS